MDDGGGGPPPDDIRIRRRRRQVAEVAEVVLPGETEHDLRVALGEIVRQNGQTAIILERLTNRIDALDDWRKQQDIDRRERGRQTFWRHENADDGARGNVAILVAIAAVVVNILPHLHWG